MSDNSARPGRPGRPASIEELLDQAVAAQHRGGPGTATTQPCRELAVVSDNDDITDVLGVPTADGEIRRLTMLFADLVDSTVLSTRVEPETYHLVVRRYREQVLAIVNRFEGHVCFTKGDGLLAVFGHPRAHDNDVQRAVAAGLDITREVRRLSAEAKRRFGIEISVRVGVHRGMVYLDTTQDDVYGLAANLTARVAGLAPRGSVVVSDAIEPLLRDAFHVQQRPPAAVKGFDGMVAHHVVVGERSEPAAVTRGPLIGRDREVQQLRMRWAHAQAGTLTTPAVLFRGEPGIGKSRLAAAAADSVERCGAVTLELIGSPFRTQVGLHPIRTLLRRRCGIERGTDPGQCLALLEAEVAVRGLDPLSVVPLLAPVVGVPEGAGYESVAAEGRQLRELIAGAVRAYLLACLAGGPGLVVAEDVHWFDPVTIEILGSLLAASDGSLLVVMTGRPGGWLPAGWPAEVMELAPLDDTQADMLVGALDSDLSADDRAAVIRRCDGVPFYIEQVVAGFTETGVPEALYESLLAKLPAGADVMPVVEAAAVVGRHVDRSLLRSVVDLSVDRLDHIIGELEEARVWEWWGPGVWRFRHELLREVAAEIAPPSLRRRLHARVGDALARRAAPDWRRIAAHYEYAEQFDQAADAYERAAAGARRRALREARNCLAPAVAHLDRAAATARGPIPT